MSRRLSVVKATQLIVDWIESDDSDDGIVEFDNCNDMLEEDNLEIDRDVEDDHTPIRENQFPMRKVVLSMISCFVPCT